MSIASEIQRLQTAKADIKTAIEAKGVTVPSSATIDTYDDYVSQITGGLTRYASGTPYCNGTNLVVDIQNEISIDGGTSWVNSGNQYTVLVESGASQCAPPYDAEIEYLQSSGTQYINTNAYITNTSNFEVGYTIAGGFEEYQWGYCHENNANGAWVTVYGGGTYYAFFGRYGSSYWVNFQSSVSNVENTIVYKSNSGLTANGTFYSKTLSLTTTDNITTIPLYIFARYDFNSRGLEYTNNTKFKSFYLKVNDTLVLDMIPVRVGQVGYMYDRVSRQLFGNDGTGDFILGADK